MCLARLTANIHTCTKSNLLSFARIALSCFLVRNRLLIIYRAPFLLDLDTATNSRKGQSNERDCMLIFKKGPSFIYIHWKATYNICPFNMTAVINEQHIPQLQRTFNLRHPVTGFAGGSGFCSAISMNLSTGTSAKGMILVFLMNLKPKYKTRMMGILMYDDTKVSVSHLRSCQLCTFCDVMLEYAYSP